VPWREDAILVPLGFDASVLTERQRRVLELVQKGWRTEEIAEELGIKPRAVRDTKCDLRKRFEAFRGSAVGRKARRRYREVAVAVALDVLRDAAGGR